MPPRAVLDRYLLKIAPERSSSRFVARCSVRLSYRSWGKGGGPNPRPRETDRARTGTDPGHDRALYPVKLQPPCSTCGLVEDLQQAHAGVLREPRREVTSSPQRTRRGSNSRMPDFTRPL